MVLPGVTTAVGCPSEAALTPNGGSVGAGFGGSSWMSSSAKDPSGTHFPVHGYTFHNFP